MHLIKQDHAANKIVNLFLFVSMNSTAINLLLANML
jgi:hypothetical protein